MKEAKTISVKSYVEATRGNQLDLFIARKNVAAADEGFC